MNQDLVVICKINGSNIYENASCLQPIKIDTPNVNEFTVFHKVLKKCHHTCTHLTLSRNTSLFWLLVSDYQEWSIFFSIFGLTRLWFETIWPHAIGPNKLQRNHRFTYVTTSFFWQRLRTSLLFYHDDIQMVRDSIFKSIIWIG